MCIAYHHEISRVFHHSKCSIEGAKGVDYSNIAGCGHCTILDGLVECLQHYVVTVGLQQNSDYVDII